MSRHTSSPTWPAPKGVLALVGIPLAALFVTALVIGAIVPDWSDGADCGVCEAAMGVVGIGGLIVGMSVAAGVWQRRVPPEEVAAEVSIRDDVLRGNSFVAGWFWVAIVIALIVIPAIANGKWWRLGIAAPLLALPAWLLRFAAVNIRAQGDELVVRNPYRTWRLQPEDIRSIDVGRLDPGKRRSTEVPFLETRRGERILLFAAVHRGPFMRLEKKAADDAVQQLRAWCRNGNAAI